MLPTAVLLALAVSPAVLSAVIETAVVVVNDTGMQWAGRIFKDDTGHTVLYGGDAQVYCI
jgi:hypothetical protein